MFKKEVALVNDVCKFSSVRQEEGSRLGRVVSLIVSLVGSSFVWEVDWPWFKEFSWLEDGGVSVEAVEFEAFSWVVVGGRVVN